MNKITGSLHSQLFYVPDHRTETYVAVGIGNTSIKIVSEQDILRLFQFSVSAGGSYMFTPNIQVSASLKYNYKERIFDRVGGSVGLKFLW